MLPNEDTDLHCSEDGCPNKIYSANPLPDPISRIRSIRLMVLVSSSVLSVASRNSVSGLLARQLLRANAIGCSFHVIPTTHQLFGDIHGRRAAAVACLSGVLLTQVSIMTL